MAFEDAVIKAKELFDTTGKKVDEVINVQKIKLSIAKQKAQIKEDFQLLGRLYYSGTKRDNVDPEALQAIVDQIELEKDKLRELETELAFAQGNIVCNECGAVNLADAEFCCKCGKEIE